MSPLSRFAPRVAKSAMIHHRQMASASTAPDPLQKIFVDKIREFKSSNLGLDDAHKKAMDDEMNRLKRVYRVQDESKLAQFETKFPAEHQVSLHDIDEKKQFRESIASGEYQKQLAVESAPKSELLATIQDQTRHDLSLPVMNKPSILPLLESTYPKGGPEISGYKPDYEIVGGKMTPERLQRDLRVEFGSNMPTIDDDNSPERDTVNFPRIKQLDYAPATRFHVIPESWFQFMYPRTGSTGPYLLGIGTFSFLMSKEWLVMDHELLTGFSSTIILSYCVIKFGPRLTKYFTKQMDDHKNGWLNWQKKHIEFLQKIKDHYNNETSRGNVIASVYEARKQDVAVQLEAEYRNRLKIIHDDTKRRLNYLVSVADSTRQIQHKNLVNWVISNAQAAIGPKQEDEVLDSCIGNLKQLASKNANVI